MLRYFSGLSMKRRSVLGRLLGLAMEHCRVGTAGQSFMGLMRFGHMWLMGDHRFVSFSIQAG
jgi:hypothetical protein